jgi:hypothetical protein
VTRATALSSDADIVRPPDSERVSEIKALMRRVVDYHGHKIAADQLGRPRAALTQALGEQSGHRVYLEDLIWAITNAPGDELLHALMEIRREPQYTDAERAEAALSAARQYLGCGDQHRGYLHAFRRTLREQRLGKADGR